MGVGLVLGFWTASLFVRVGQGTPAPWDHPQNLVVRGPYRHVRNPMISSVLLVLLGEALVFQSWSIGGWGLLFFAINSVYFPLSEEKALERRFGDDYLAYKANVPRWLPRLTPWRRSQQGSPSDG
jgi:protein-S-isoprenylcysteine O-methyltransferase Ste14